MDDLGGQVFGRAAQRIGFDGVLVIVISQPLGKPKIHQLDVPFGVEKQVFGLHIPVGDAPLGLVEILQYQNYLGSVEACHLLVEASVLAQVREQLAAGDIVQNQIQKVVVRKGADKAGYEGMARHVGENLPFVTNVVDLLQFDDCRNDQ